MIKIENTQVFGWEPAIRGMRNPMNSWDRSDSTTCYNIPCSECRYFVDSACTHKTPRCSFAMGENDLKLAKSLVKGGSVHAKFRRMIQVYIDVTAPLYWWKEADTYKIGTVINSCSTMHKIHSKEFTLDDFSHEHLFDLETESYAAYDYYDNIAEELLSSKDVLQIIINALNEYRQMYIKCGDKNYWWQMIQLLPSSYNQKRTWMLNYEVLSNIYISRKDHKLDEWREFCDWIETLPYSELIIGEDK